MGKYFGTDGFRGEANVDLNYDHAVKIGRFLGWYYGPNRGKTAKILIGKDTRLSGYMLEPALTAGFTSMGMDVFLFGPLPTTYRKNKRPFHPSPTALDRS